MGGFCRAESGLRGTFQCGLRAQPFLPPTARADSLARGLAGMMGEMKLAHGAALAARLQLQGRESVWGRPLNTETSLDSNPGTASQVGLAIRCHCCSFGTPVGLQIPDLKLSQYKCQEGTGCWPHRGAGPGHIPAVYPDLLLSQHRNTNGMAPKSKLQLGSPRALCCSAPSSRQQACQARLTGPNASKSRQEHGLGTRRTLQGLHEAGSSLGALLPHPGTSILGMEATS